MLGKGLESLIPRKSSGGAGKRDGDGGVSQDAPGSPQEHGSVPLSSSGDNAAPRRPVRDGEHTVAGPDGGTPASSPPRDGGGDMLLSPPASPPPVAPSSRQPPQAVDGSPVRRPTPSSAIFHIEVDKIIPNPHQPRRRFDEGGIRELATSIREFGILQPIVVTKVEREVPTGTEVEYTLIAGERRLLAAKLLGMERVPAIIRRVDAERERLELAIIENLQREDLNPIEAARAFSRLQDEFRLTQREIAARVGKSREVIANAVRLLDLPRYIQDALERGQVSESHGRVLLSVGDPAAQKRLFDELVAHQLTTRELRERVERGKSKERRLVPEERVPPHIRMAQDRLAGALGAPVTIRQSGERKGKITIEFYSPEELQSILSRLGAPDDEL